MSIFTFFFEVRTCRGKNGVYRAMLFYSSRKLHLSKIPPMKALGARDFDEKAKKNMKCQFFSHFHQSHGLRMLSWVKFLMSEDYGSCKEKHSLINTTLFLAERYPSVDRLIFQMIWWYSLLFDLLKPTKAFSSDTPWLKSRLIWIVWCFCQFLGKTPLKRSSVCVIVSQKRFSVFSLIR